MGTSSKRRGDGQASQRKSSNRSVKERQQAHFDVHSSHHGLGSDKHAKADDAPISKRHRDRERDRDGNRLTSSNVTHMAPSSTQSQTNTNNNPTIPRRRKILNTSLLARGMTARYMGVRVAHHMKTLAPSELERDLRHMEAYGAACVSYAQQLFAFSNRDLVARGHYGPAPPAPGMTFAPPGGGGTSGGSSGSGGEEANGGNQQHSNGVVTPHMPVRIDPEEEKRLAILRKRVAASEAKREVLETEYLSLRAHYVHESHKLRRTRSAVNGQLKLLRELVQRRGKVLAYKRVKCAIARDILACLDYRNKAPVSSSAPSSMSMTMDVDVNEVAELQLQVHKEKDPMAMEGVEEQVEDDCGGMMPPQTRTHSPTSKGKITPTDKVPMDLLDVWSLLESKINEAELACREVQTPDELLYIKSALCADAAALEHANEASSGYGSGSGSGSGSGDRRARSPMRGSDTAREQEEDDHGGSGSGSGSNSNSNNNFPTNKKKSRHDRYARRGSNSNSEDTTTASNPKKSDLDTTNDNVIPWSCRAMPRTPYGVALYLSNLSSSPELAAAHACDNIFGSAPQSLTWLEANLPSKSYPGAEQDAAQLLKLQEQVSNLETELSHEISTNSKLQKNIIHGRNKNDELCAMMTMIRTETEAVVVRHNQILETDEAIRASRILDEKEKKQEGGKEEKGRKGEVSEGNGKGLDQGEEEEGTVVAEDDADVIGANVQNSHAFGASGETGTLNKYVGGNYYASDEEDDNQSDDPSRGQPMLEVIVPGSGSPEGNVEAHGMGGVSSGATKRGYTGANDMHVDPDKKRRKV